MYLKSCKCGETTKNFKHDIGPFFMNTCCIIAEATPPIPAPIPASNPDPPKADPPKSFTPKSTKKKGRKR